MPYIFQDMMNKICTHCFNLPYTYFQNNLSGSIVGRMQGIGDNYHKMHQSIEGKLSKPLLITLFSGITLAYINIKIFTVIIAFTAFYLPLALRFFTKLAKMEQAKQDSWYNLFGTVADCITNIFTIFSFASKQRELNKVQDYYRNVHNPLTIRYYKYDLIISIILALVYWVYLIGVFVYVIYLRNLGEISIGDIAFIMSLTFLFAENSWHATMAVKDFLEDVAAFRSSFTIMQIPQDTIDKENAAELKISKGEIIFKDISFSYKEGSSVFQSLNLHIKAGEKVGIVGHSGGGKSTLISLLLKNFKASSGDIIIDNQSVYDTSSDSLRKQISLIPQDIMLFHRGIGENIGYAKENALPQEIENAAKAANIHEFIESLPEKYNTIVGERGVKLSGGQRQRIAIARAILKNAPILVLDEATSSLDSHTEQEVQKSINTMLDIDNVTIIAIAHRLSTIKHMDRIIVMDKGKIIEDGTFTELVRKENGKFKELWEHQVNGFV
ncbi:Putative multidrug export ATP-binding/permease protein [Rickettsia tillamookensis]|uniref:Multidrug export ATP-binding/permease protein n=2 Tax=Rickettsia tillamookensis TaxID=2761623 RepID=A0A9E6MH97_9RICK|nr:ABC transporter ATP-binding protein [Rickettsia tillamookensis]QQV74764.1 Putative multidrug export ATP-binding/permease protein [Rickettsia tillamookensis]